jgi:hypothetical protein
MAKKPSPSNAAPVIPVWERLPGSAGHLTANILGGVLFFSVEAFLRRVPEIGDGERLLLALAAAMLPMMLVDFVREFHAGSCRARQELSLRRVFIKLTGLYATFSLLLGVYWLFPEYESEFYRKALTLLREALPWLMLGALPYIFWVDRRMEQPEDGVYHFGLLLLRYRAADRRMAAEHLRNWAVKAFFLPLMATFLIQNMNYQERIVWEFPSFLKFSEVTLHLLFTIDLLYACTGYLMTFRPLRTQIYSAEPTLSGWFWCLACYIPFWPDLLYPRYFNYDDSYFWEQMTAGSPLLQYAWGGAILLCTFIYAWATVAFGYRFSNLTYRGLITGGPYRFTKHPAYVFKSASWWLMSVPFLSSLGWQEAARDSLLLAGVCFIYYMRARTEENHLSNYPEYVAYAEWMNEHGMFRRLAKRLPFLRYSREQAHASGSRVYPPATGREVVRLPG